jgi:hypothetical protein
MVAFCPSCQAKLKFPDNQAGRKFRCPHCNEVGTAPIAGAKPPPTAELVEDDDPSLTEERRRRRPTREDDNEPDDDRPRRRRLKRKGINRALVNTILVVGSVAVVAGISGGLFYFLIERPPTNDKLTAENIQKIKMGMTLDEAEELLGKASPANSADIQKMYDEFEKMTRTRGTPAAFRPSGPQVGGAPPGATKYMWRHKYTWLFVDVDDATKKIVGTYSTGYTFNH